MKYKLKITASRWPWQKRGTNIFGMHMGRFGGGWNYNLGFQIGSKTILLNLLFGMICISLFEKDKE